MKNNLWHPDFSRGSNEMESRRFLFKHPGIAGSELILAKYGPAVVFIR